MLRGLRLSPGDVVVIPEPFSDRVWNQAIVTEITSKNVKLFRVQILPGKVQGNENKIVPFMSGDETVISLNSDMPIQIVQKVQK